MGRQGLVRLFWLALGLAAWGCATTDNTINKSDGLAGKPTPVSASKNTQASAAENQTIVQTSAKESSEAPARGQKPDEAARPRRKRSENAEAPFKLTGEAAKARPVAEIVAAVNQTPIFDDEVRTSTPSLHGAQSQQEYNKAFKEGLDHIIGREAVLQEAFGNLEKGGKQGQRIIQQLNDEAEKSFENNYVQPLIKRYHLHSREELAAAMESQNVSLDMLRHIQMREWLFMQYVLTRINPLLEQVGYRDILKYYDGHPEEFRVAESVDWQDIYVECSLHSSQQDARRWAEHLADRIRKGEDFLAISREFDNGECKLRKGEGVGHLRGKIDPPALEAPLFQMNEGEVRVLETTYGFHIVRVVKHQKAGPMPFDADVQKRIHGKLKNEMIATEVKRYVKNAQKKSAVWKDPRYGP